MKRRSIIRCKRGLITLYSPSLCTEIPKGTQQIELVLSVSEDVPVTVRCVNWNGSAYVDQTAAVLTPRAGLISSVHADGNG